MIDSGSASRSARMSSLVGLMGSPVWTREVDLAQLVLLHNAQGVACMRHQFGSVKFWPIRLFAPPGPDFASSLTYFHVTFNDCSLRYANSDQRYIVQGRRR